MPSRGPSAIVSRVASSSRHPTPRRRWGELALALALCLLFFNVLFAGVSLAYAVLPRWLAILLRYVAVIGGAYGLIRALYRWAREFTERHASAFCLGLAALAVFLFGGQNHLSTCVWLARGENADGITLAELRDHADASYVRLEGAEFRRDRARYRGWYVSVDDDELTHYHAAPIVAPGWTPRQPVTAWAVSDEERWWALERAPEDVPLQGMIEDNHRYLRHVLHKNGEPLLRDAVAIELTVNSYEAQLVLTWRRVRQMLQIMNAILLALCLGLVTWFGRPPWRRG